MKVNSTSKIVKYKKYSKPYIIAEIGVNHGGDLDTAKKLIKLAKEGGADAAKFQTYKADKIASINSPAYWNIEKEATKSQHELFKKYDSLEQEDYIELASYCNTIGIEFLSTPFDLEAVDSLDPLVKLFKIASADITNLPLLEKVASKKKPIILSTGASNKDEINRAIETLVENGISRENIILLHCILNYPTEDKNANLLMIKDLISSYPEHRIGYSDHTEPETNMTPITTAFILGASVIEKHFTYDKNLPGNDHYHSMDMNDLKILINKIDLIINLLGNNRQKEPIETETISRLNARRSLVLNKRKNAGDHIKKEDLICKRPGTGISPYEINSIVGKKIKSSLAEDHVITWSDILSE